MSGASVSGAAAVELPMLLCGSSGSCGGVRGGRGSCDRSGDRGRSLRVLAARS